MPTAMWEASRFCEGVALRRLSPDMLRAYPAIQAPPPSSSEVAPRALLAMVSRRIPLLIQIAIMLLLGMVTTDSRRNASPDWGLGSRGRSRSCATMLDFNNVFAYDWLPDLRGRFHLNCQVGRGSVGGGNGQLV